MTLWLNPSKFPIKISHKFMANIFSLSLSMLFCSFEMRHFEQFPAFIGNSCVISRRISLDIGCQQSVQARKTRTHTCTHLHTRITQIRTSFNVHIQTAKLFYQVKLKGTPDEAVVPMYKIVSVFNFQPFHILICFSLFVTSHNLKTS